MMPLRSTLVLHPEALDDGGSVIFPRGAALSQTLSGFWRASRRKRSSSASTSASQRWNAYTRRLTDLDEADATALRPTGAGG